jgi:hypothetical protein
VPGSNTPAKVATAPVTLPIKHRVCPGIPAFLDGPSEDLDVRTRLAPAALAVVLALQVGACDGGGLPVGTASSPSASTSAPPAAATPGTPAAEILMCDLVTGADVSGASPFSIPLEAVQPQTAQPGSCVYQFHKDGEYASIRIDLVAFDSQETALGALRAHSEDIQSAHGITREVVAGLGDQAAWSVSTVEDAGIDVVTGSRLITVSLGSQSGKVTDAARRAAAIALATLVLGRMH